MPIFGNVNPEDTIWYPHEDGDYSAWVDQFDSKMHKYCATPKHFEVGIKRKPLPLSLINSLSSGSNYERLADDVLVDDDLGRYLNIKAGWLVFVALGVVFIVASIFAACALFRRVRKWFRKCGACQDRPRVSPPHLKRGTIFYLKVGSVALISTLAALGLVLIVLTALLGVGIKSTSCDVWNTMRGYYFGAVDMSLAAGVVPTWKGSQVQREAMLELDGLVNPTDASQPAALYTQINESIHTNLVPSLEATRDDVTGHLNEAFVFMSALENILNKYAADFTDVTPSGSVAFPTGIRSHLNAMMLDNYDMFVQQLATTVEQGIVVAQQKVDDKLGKGSSLLDLAVGNTQTALTSLIDVDYVMAKMIVMWDHQLTPALFPVLNLLVAAGAIFGAFALIGSIMGLVFFLKTGLRFSEVKALSERATNWLGRFFAVSVIVSAFAFLFSAIYFLLGSIGKDTCGVIDYTAFRDGNWSVFPNALFDATVSNKTNVFTILDTCVLDSGDGDIGSALGIDLLLQKLKTGVSSTKVEIKSAIADVIKEDRRRAKLEGLASALVDSGNMMWQSPLQIQDSGASSYIKYVSYDGFDAVRPTLTDFSRSNLCLTNALGEKLDFGGVISSCLADGLVQVVPGVDAALDKISSVVNSLEDASLFNQYCSDSFGYCSKLDEGVEARPYTFSNSSKRADLADVLKAFAADPTDTTAGEELTRAQMTEEGVRLTALIEIMLVMEKELVCPLDSDILKLTTLYVNAENRGIFYTQEQIDNGEVVVPVTTGGSHTQVYKSTGPVATKNPKRVPATEVLALLPDPEHCTFKLQDNATGKPVCTIRDVILTMTPILGASGEHMLGAFNEALSIVNNFVDVDTMGRVDELLQTATDSLDDFNCQFVGTSLKNGAATGLCKIVFPAAAGLGVTTVLMWAVTVLSCTLAWKVYHYNRDLHAEGESVEVQRATSEIGLASATSDPSYS